MKKISVYFCFLFFILFSYSCNDMYDKIDNFVQEEKVYPGGFDRASGCIGYERVEIDLLNAGRIPAGQVNLGKAKKTVIEYDKEVITIDSLCSWVNIKNLTLSKLYRFKIYTIDEYGDKSIPVEAALIPYTLSDKNNLVISAPRIVYQPDGATVSWVQSLNSILLNYYGLSFSYIDKSGVVRTGNTTGQTPSITMDNLVPGTQVTLNLKHTVIPKVNNVAIIDTVYLADSIVITCAPAPVITVALKTPPARTYYPVGRQLDLTGAVITVTTDGNAMNVPVTGSMISGYDPDVVGVQTVTVTYEGETTTFDVEVLPILPTLAERIAAVAGTTATVTLYFDELSAPIVLNGNTDITLEGYESERTISLNTEGSSLFTLSGNAKLTLGDKVTLKGMGTNSNSNASLITIGGSSTLTMLEGSKLSDNWKDSNYGSVVFMSGTSTTAAQFIMNGGSITNNRAKGYGAVYLETGTFTMNGGTINNNVATDASVVRGGAMYIAAGGVFNMTGGTISGNNNGLGGGVHNNGSFNLSGGTITGNTSSLNIPDVYVRKSAIVFNLSGSPVTNVALETDSKITQNAAFSGNVTIDLGGAATDWNGKTVLTKGGSYQGAYGNFTLGSFINTGTGSKTAISGYHIGTDGKLTN
jgi:hypothetical protein